MQNKISGSGLEHAVAFGKNTLQFQRRNPSTENSMHLFQLTRSDPKHLVSALLFALAATTAAVDFKEHKAFRPPAVPLVACDPYFSIWSYTDELAGGTTRHWTDRNHPLNAMVCIDGKPFRIMGSVPTGIPPLPQKSLKVLPTRTRYTFAGEGVQLEFEFLQAALPDDIDLMSRPIVYATWRVTSTDGRDHTVNVYLDAAMDLVVHERKQEVTWSEEQFPGLQVLKAGTTEQHILGRKGDGVRIDWGHFYLAADRRFQPESIIAMADEARSTFVQSGRLTRKRSAQPPRRVNDDAPVMAIWFPLAVAADQPAVCQAILAYDDIDSILYFGDRLRPYWKRNGKNIGELLVEAAGGYDSIARRCEQFDRELLEDLYRAGGIDYQLIGALAYRQALGANKIVVDRNGMPLMFSKECYSNGCMGTVDVFYPFAPQVLLFNPVLAKASFVPILEYARSQRWAFPFAPHDVGTYPHAMGQVYGGGERSEQNQMPVEECGNMIILVAAVAEAENDIGFAREYWDVLTTWADYLESKGLDPENQLCTDDFAGHLAHNVNLSAKAIVALGAYAEMAEKMGEKDIAEKYRKTAEQYVEKWMAMADDGEHYRLAFDKPGSWSQKYNLVWDRILGLGLFPDSVAEKEMAYYKRMQNPYGLPLDNRKEYTKLDWIFWTASITGSKSDFEALIAPITVFLNETPDRVPMTDWYWTHDAKKRGFQARPVVGGVFIRLLDDKPVWKKWVERADSVAGVWARVPAPPKLVEVVPSSETRPQNWYYTFIQPSENWATEAFNPEKAGWKNGPGGFGTRGTPGANVRTIWDTSDVWIRRSFDLAETPKNLQLLLHHDENAEIYINGIPAARADGYTTQLEPVEISAAALETIRPAGNTIAIHCHQTSGGQYIDAGLVQLIPQD
jgi:hypothetical protein